MAEQYNKSHVIAIDMGYGHQRAAYPFLPISEAGVISANDYPGIKEAEKKDWESGRKWYELLSYFKKVPFLGDLAFSVMDYFQKIEPFYPRRDLSKQITQQKYFFDKVKNGLGRDLIHNLNKNPLPFLTTFFVCAYFAEYHGYKNEIYCVVCDADISRSWAPVNPKESRIIYLAPNKRVKERLQLYGVRANHIYVTGFPLPKENIGSLEEQEILKTDLRTRLFNLDPRQVYYNKYRKTIEEWMDPQKYQPQKRILTLTFAVGGAGAQRELGVTILHSLRNKIKAKEIKLNLIAGIRKDVADLFAHEVKDCELELGSEVEVIYSEDKMTSFKMFNQTLHNTDILWTKPSELSFYSGLGLPIIMSDPVGSQEHYNRDWLMAIGAGVDNQDPKYTDEWLFDWVNSGWLAEAAMKGFMDAPKLGTYHVEDIVLRHKISEIQDAHLL
ncbi:MAG: hypothetical protein MUF50_00255 [Planctomycetes bacterium]|jgi:hypothetical protein|nr:hypothetical protein [Planctomycetota bacterium]